MSSQAGNARNRRLGELRDRLARRDLQGVLAAVEPLLRIDARDPELLTIAARAHHESGAHRRAIVLCDRAIALARHPEPLLIRGDAHRSVGLTECAVADLRACLALAPGMAEVRLALVAALEESGSCAEAREELAPLLGSEGVGTGLPRVAYEHAKLLVREGSYVEAVAAIDAALVGAQPGSMPMVLLLLLRAKALDRLGDHAQAWESAQRAHASRRSDFDPATLREAAEAVMARWTRASLAQAGSSADTDPLPAFVAGMPRSGTSLVDQLVHAHPEGAGVGELESVEAWADSVDSVALRADGARIPTDHRSVARTYLAELRRLAPGKLRVINKALGNVRVLGHLARLFPGSRVIHLRRDPRDVAVSCVFGGFGSAKFPWTMRPEWVAEAWRESERLMDHWSRELDLPMIRVEYEALVQEGEPQIRRMVEFLGLRWDPGVLEFHCIRRTVRTLSYDQVSRPLHAESVGRWRNYEQFLRGVNWPRSD